MEFIRPQIDDVVNDTRISVQVFRHVGNECVLADVDRLPAGSEPVVMVVRVAEETFVAVIHVVGRRIRPVGKG